MNAAALRQPYPGLRSFDREEADLFFGREDCIDLLVDLLARQRFLAVLGSSGSGKSSLVKTGLLDALELGWLATAGSQWRVAEFRPGQEPVRNLASALLNSDGGKATDNEVASLSAFLARGSRSAIEWWCKNGHVEQRENLLLLVDQFEELFRYHDNEGRDEAEAFVALLLESAKLSNAVPIYVVLTMRSEYLGACSLIDGLAERISSSLFLTGRMNREQCRAAIEGPAAVCGITIEPALVNHLLNDLSSFAPWDAADRSATTIRAGGADQPSVPQHPTSQLDRLARRADQLPLLQHVLNRMWQRTPRPVSASGEPGSLVLRLEDYKEMDGLQGALTKHAGQILEKLEKEDPGKQSHWVAEIVFRSLTAGTSVADAARRPTTFGQLQAIANDEKLVRAVVDAFRAPEANFLVPDGSVSLTPETRIDISHESIIRQWPALGEWLRRESDAASIYRTLEAKAQVWKQQKEPFHWKESATFLDAAEKWSRSKL